MSSVFLDALGQPASPGGGAFVPIWMKRTGTGTFTLTNTAQDIGLSTELNAVNVGGQISYSGNQFTALAAGSYRLGASLMFRSAAQRAQFTSLVYINGVTDNVQRGQGYIRNSSVAYDFWPISIANEPFELNANDTIELRVGRTNVGGGVYGFGGSTSIIFERQYSLIWLEKIG